MDGKQTGSDEPTWQFKPGETISPRKETAEQPSGAVSPATEQSSPSAQASPAPQASSSGADAPQASTETTPPESAPESVSSKQPPSAYSDEDYTQSGYGLQWTASEFIAHEKTAGWHTGLIAVAVVAAVALWFITKDIVTAVVVVVAGGMLSLYGARRPGEQQYQLDDDGLSIGAKHYGFNEFRAFSLVPEGAFASIALLPTKRFAPMTTIYFAPEDGDAILQILGDHLPQQPMKADLIDGLMRKIRF